MPVFVPRLVISVHPWGKANDNPQALKIYTCYLELSLFAGYQAVAAGRHEVSFVLFVVANADETL